MLLNHRHGQIQLIYTCILTNPITPRVTVPLLSEKQKQQRRSKNILLILLLKKSKDKSIISEQATTIQRGVYGRMVAESLFLVRM